MSTPQSGAQIRQAFLDFYAARGHERLPSASLVPEDPTVLLIIACVTSLTLRPLRGSRYIVFPLTVPRWLVVF
jgi:alanyl-tRNA synthetase